MKANGSWPFAPKSPKPTDRARLARPASRISQPRLRRCSISSERSRWKVFRAGPSKQRCLSNAAPETAVKLPRTLRFEQVADAGEFLRGFLVLVVVGNNKLLFPARRPLHILSTSQHQAIDTTVFAGTSATTLRACLKRVRASGVAQVSKPAVSPTSKSAARRKSRAPWNKASLAGLETRDPADLEVCATAAAPPAGFFRQALNKTTLIVL